MPINTINPLAEQDANMAEYENLLAEAMDDVAGNFINCAVWVSGGSVAAAQYPATVGHFVVRQILGPGGFSPRLMGQAIVRKANLPDGAFFKTGDKLTVTQAGGSVRACQVEDIEDTYTEWRINLWDVNQGA